MRINLLERTRNVFERKIPDHVWPGMGEGGLLSDLAIVVGLKPGDFGLVRKPTGDSDSGFLGPDS